MTAKHSRKREEFKIHHRLTLGAVGILGSFICLLLSNSQITKIISSMMMIGTVGASLSLVNSAGQIAKEKGDLEKQWILLNREKQIEKTKYVRLRKNLETQILKLQSHIRDISVKHKEATGRLSLTIATTKASLAQEEKKAQKLESEFQGKIAVEEAKAIRLESEFEKRVSRATEQIEAEYLDSFEERIEEGIAIKREEFEEQKEELEEQKTERVKLLRSAQVKKLQALHETIEALKEKITQQETRFREEFDIASQKYKALITEYDEVLAVANTTVHEAKSEFTASYSSMEQENMRLRAQVQQYHSPATFKGSALGDHVGNKVLTFFMKKGIVIDAESFHQSPTHIDVRVRPRGHTPQELRQLDEALQLELETIDKPTFSLDKGCVVIKVRHAASEKLKAVIERLPADFIFEIIKRSNHYRIAAPTDYGKSYFLDNLIWAMQIYHMGGMRLSLLDPKFPFTKWSGHEPDYKGFEESLSGFGQLANLIDDRFRVARKAVESGGEIPLFPAHFFAIDEMETLSDEARLQDAKEETLPKAERNMWLKKVSLLSRRGLKMGRGLTKEPGKGIGVAYITQTPLCSRIGLNVDDFFNSTSIILGADIDYVLENELNKRITEQQKTKLRRQINLRRDAGEKFFALVVMGETSVIWDLPKMGLFSERYENEIGRPARHLEEGKITTLEFDKAPPPPAPAPAIEVKASTVLSDTLNLEPDSSPEAKPVEQEQGEVLQCPKCSSSQMSIHGTYKKKAVGNKPAVVKTRWKCGQCKKTTIAPIVVKTNNEEG